MSKFTQALNRIQAHKEKNQLWPEALVRPVHFGKFTLSTGHLIIVCAVFLNAILLPLIYHFGVIKGMDLSEQFVFSLGDSGGQIEFPESRLLAEGPADAFSSLRIVQQGTEAGNPFLVPMTSQPLMLSATERPPNYFTIQLVTYTGIDIAEAQAEKLRAEGHDVFILQKGKFYQLCMDSFESRSDALRRLVEFRSNGYYRIYQDAFVRPIQT